MRAILIAMISLVVGFIIAQGGVGQRVVSWLSPTVEAASGGETKSSFDRNEVTVNAQELEAEAEAYDEEADEIQAQVLRYKHLAAQMTPTVDPKGFRRDAFIMAAGAQSKAVGELRQLAAHHRTESKRLLAKLEAR